MTATPRDLELGSGFLGNEPGRPLRALGAILGDLADLRRTARWIGLPTSLTGAPHHRFSIFTIAYRRGAVPDAASNRLLSGRRDDGDGQGPPRHYRTEPSDSRPRIQRTGGLDHQLERSGDSVRASRQHLRRWREGDTPMPSLDGGTSPDAAPLPPHL